MDQVIEATGRTFGYTRVSTADQAEGTSLQQQAEALDAYCTAQGWPAPAVYADNVSGATDGRPGLRAMLAEVRPGDRVLVLKLDRWARNVRQALELLDGLERQNVAFVSVRDALDTTTPAGRLMRTVMLAMAEWEADTIYERVEAGRRGAVSIKGRRANGRIPFGYKRGMEPGSLQPDPVTAAVVVSLFKARARRTGRPSYAAIAAELTAEGIPTPQGGAQWHARTVQLVIENPTYRGIVRYGVRPQGKRTRRKVADPLEAQGKHEGLVSDGQWRIAQSRRKPA